MPKARGKVKKNRYGIIIPYKTKNLIMAVIFDNLGIVRIMEYQNGNG